MSTEKWPYVPAKWQKHVGPRRDIRLIIIHDMEARELTSTAENVADWFSVTSRPASAHLCIDSDSIIRCVEDNNIAFAAPGANNDGLHIELAGYATQDGLQWLDPYGVLMLDKAAKATAQWCVQYQIPTVFLTSVEVAAGRKGITGHAQVSMAYKKSDHTDPGEHFPWQWFIGRTKEHYDRLRLKVVKA